MSKSVVHKLRLVIQDKYADGLTLAPDGHKVRAVLFCNRAACHLEVQQYQEAVKDCSSAIDLDGEYLKAWHRRARAYEGLDDMDRALRDVQKVISISSTLQVILPMNFHVCCHQLSLAHG